MKKVLILLTASFPYNNGESFLETEMEYSLGFDEVLCIPCDDIKNESGRKIQNNKVEVINLSKSTFSQSKLYKFIQYFRSVFTKNVLKETISLIKNKSFTSSRLKELLFFQSMCNNNVRLINKVLKEKKYNSHDEIVMYSYWMSYQACIAIKLKHKYHNSKCITRAHGYDLYEYRRSNNYIPLRKFILENMDKIYCISSDGEDYLNRTYRGIKKNILISRLGTKDYGVRYIDKDRGTLQIVSCSNVILLKRIKRIIDSLSSIKLIDISWTHYGDGVLLSELKEYAKEVLPQNIQYHFKGHVSNEELMNIYKSRDIHLFINVSESEGIPVTIMEAMSFGIPVIATNVGGTKEIVLDNINGKLLSKEFKDQDLVNLITEFYYMKEEDYIAYRDNARNTWNENYNAKNNYEEFYKNI